MLVFVEIQHFFTNTQTFASDNASSYASVIASHLAGNLASASASVQTIQTFQEPRSEPDPYDLTRKKITR